RRAEPGRRDPRQLRRTRERPLGRAAGRAGRSAEAVRVLPGSPADVRGGCVTDGAPPRYEPIAVSSESTVVAEFLADAAQEAGYQSEAELEQVFIALLEEQAYE